MKVLLNRNEIKEFLSLNYAQLMSDIGQLDTDLEEYYKLVEAADAQIEATTKRSKFASKRSLIVKSASRTLKCSWLHASRADGILGPDQCSYHCVQRGSLTSRTKH